MDRAELADPADLLPRRVLQRARPEREAAVPVPGPGRVQLLALGRHHDRGVHRRRFRGLGGRCAALEKSAFIRPARPRPSRRATRVAAPVYRWPATLHVMQTICIRANRARNPILSYARCSQRAHRVIAKAGVGLTWPASLVFFVDLVRSRRKAWTKQASTRKGSRTSSESASPSRLSRRCCSTTMQTIVAANRAAELTFGSRTHSLLGGRIADFAAPGASAPYTRELAALGARRPPGAGTRVRRRIRRSGRRGAARRRRRHAVRPAIRPRPDP